MEQQRGNIPFIPVCLRLKEQPRDFKKVFISRCKTKETRAKIGTNHTNKMAHTHDY